ncbi:Bromo adjacent homology (BAH) domain [Dillenia turbinata]|uniref:Bromo adjacent homology (BAH) domain n=1 Tax=Dillenia turbinata TaxID=194707 RepID=A0AAN8VC00_9MAGN
MWSAPTTTTLADDSNSFFKFPYLLSNKISPITFSERSHVWQDGRKISVGDCALFKPPQDSPPFIGIIRCLAPSKDSKDHNLNLGVNWLYRPAEVKLGKGVLLEAAPNEVFYSFHKDEIPAALLLHPCKVTFLPKGVELPSGVSSFVCRRVYDIANKCLWWLTDKDYINERQEEVDKLLFKTQVEMNATVQPGGRSPKPVNVPSTMSPLKPGSDSVQNSNTAVPSQVKGKKRERGDQISEPVKRERSFKTDEVDSFHSRDGYLKSEIAKITERGGLIDSEGVERLVQLMQPERTDKKIDLTGRSILAGVIAATDRFDCLGRFVQLRGLPILDEWLQDIHKGKVGDGSSPKESDRQVEDFLLVLLRALDKLPVNLNALQMCNIGKSVNHLRSHKNLEIQKKARSLVDTWKKGVEAEMNINDAKSGSNQTVPWSAKPGLPEVSHGASRRTGGSSEVAMKGSVLQPSASKAPGKHVQGEVVAKAVSISGGSNKYVPVLNTKDQQPKAPVGGSSDPNQSTGKDEKSSSSSQSHNNSQSCSSDQAKAVGFSGKEDARSSTAGSPSMNKVSGAHRHRKSVNGFPGGNISGHKECGSNRSSSHRNLASEKLSQSGLTCDKAFDAPTIEGSNQKLIVKIPNRGRSPAQSASGGSFEDPSITNSRASSPMLSEKHEQFDRNSKEKGDAYRANAASDVNTESWQSNDFKDVLTGSDEGDGSPAPVTDEEHGKTTDDGRKITDDGRKMTETSIAASSSSGNKLKAGKLHDASFSALIESCVKCSEADTSVPVGDDVGMNLLASVAAGEILKSDLVSPNTSPQRDALAVEGSFTGNNVTVKELSSNEHACEQGQTNDGTGGVGNVENQVAVEGNSLSKDGLQHVARKESADLSGDSKVIYPISEGKPLADCKDMFDASSSKSPQISVPGLESNRRKDEPTVSPSMPDPAVKLISNGTNGGDCKQLNEKQSVVSGVNVDDTSVAKPTARSPLPAEDKVNVSSCVEVGKEVVENLSRPSLDVDGEFKDNVLENDRSKSGIVADLKPLTVSMHSEMTKSTDEKGLVLTGPGEDWAPESIYSSKEEKPDDVGAKNLSSWPDNRRAGKEIKASPTCGKKIVSASGTMMADRKSEYWEDNLERKEVLEHFSGGDPVVRDKATVSVQQTEMHGRSRVAKPNHAEAGEADECVSTTADGSFSAMGGSDPDVKLEFDLNEGFNADEGKYGKTNSVVAPGTSAAIHIINPLPIPVPSASTGLPAPITVKGPFMPPEDLLRSKGELGWKGSAATSAFRPAEPRKVLETPVSTANVPPPNSTVIKPARAPLDFDLNVPDERILEDLASQSAALDTCPMSEAANSCHVTCDGMAGSQPSRSSGGLDLDLNQADEATELGEQFSTTNNCRMEVPLRSVKPSSSSTNSSAEVSARRDFDLNNGPVLDETGAEPSALSQHSRGVFPSQQPLTSMRLNNANLENFSTSWFAPGSTYPAVTFPSILPDREQPFSIVSSGGAQRILGPPVGVNPFSPDVFRGPILSSSPAVPFPSTHFQYPFPFGTVPSATFPSGSTTYMDSSSAGRLCFPAVQTSLLGPAGAIPSHFPRPYAVGLPDGCTSGGVESNRRSGRHGLDLNAGPGGVNAEGRDEALALPSRQLPVASSQALAEEQARMFQMAGGVLKRKEPEGGWDSDRFSYKPSSWQ